MSPEEMFRALMERLQSAEARLNALPRAKDGRDGRDGKDGKDGMPGARGERGATGEAGPQGLPGVDGENGRDGRDGRDGQQGIPGRDGRDGKDGTNGRDGKDGEPGPMGRTGPRGEMGTPGEDGLPGATPRHEWRGTEIRFEIEPGVWGDWVDLKGDRGMAGVSVGGLSASSMRMDGGGAFDSNTGLDGQFADTDFTGIPGVGGGGADTVFAATTFNAGRAI